MTQGRPAPLRGAAQCQRQLRRDDWRRIAYLLPRGGERAKERRPELLRALDFVRLTGATLVIPKLDRLSYNAAFLLTLRDAGVRFLACGMPQANDLNLGIIALVAQQEREAISRHWSRLLLT